MSFTLNLDIASPLTLVLYEESHENTGEDIRCCCVVDSIVVAVIHCCGLQPWYPQITHIMHNNRHCSLSQEKLISCRFFFYIIRQFLWLKFRKREIMPWYLIHTIKHPKTTSRFSLAQRLSSRLERFLVSLAACYVLDDPIVTDCSPRQPEWLSVTVTHVTGLRDTCHRDIMTQPDIWCQDTQDTRHQRHRNFLLSNPWALNRATVILNHLGQFKLCLMGRTEGAKMWMVPPWDGQWLAFN